MMKKTVIDSQNAYFIINPVSGKVDAVDRVKHIGKIAKTLGWKGKIVTTKKDKGAEILALDAITNGYKHIVVGGGDGTIMEVLGAVLNKPVILGVIPLGTGNIFAKNLHIPEGIEEAVTIALNGKIRTIDVGNANGTIFSIMAGMGLDVTMMQKADRDMKNKIGFVAYVVAALKSLGKHRKNYRIVIDNKIKKTYRAKSIMIANMGKITGGIQVVPKAHPTSGELRIGILQAHSLHSWIGVLFNTLKGKVQESSHYTLLRGHKIDVYPLSGPQSYECDGNVFPPTDNLSIEVYPKAVSILVP